MIEIEVQKQYKITLTETQAKELYEFLRGAKDVGHLSVGHLSVDTDLILVYNELKDIFGGGIR